MGKGVYPYEYMDDWEKLTEKSHLKMKDITNVNYVHGKRVYKDFNIRNLENYHDLSILSDTLLLSDTF